MPSVSVTGPAWLLPPVLYAQQGSPPDSATSRASEAQRPGPLPAPPWTPCSGLLSLPPGSRLCEGIGRAKRLNRTVSGWGGAHSPQLGKGTSSPSQGRTAVLSGELRSASQRGCARPSAPPSVCKTESTRDTLWRHPNSTRQPWPGCSVGGDPRQGLRPGCYWPDLQATRHRTEQSSAGF